MVSGCLAETVLPPDGEEITVWGRPSNVLLHYSKKRPPVQTSDGGRSELRGEEQQSGLSEQTRPEQQLERRAELSWLARRSGS